MNDLHHELKVFIIETMNLEDITPTDIGEGTLLFADDGLGLDSIDALELVLALKKKYGVVLEANDETARQHLSSVVTLAALIESQR
ncbi:phosphopantetheine-binding protein [Ferribacterium limneticum]|uniref:phosphopantetheine-binding protein n=1 Tax=Ferribacterium limneticum TaxID=76259 RepID=UPI001CFB7C5D|nr:phosphopantetheine-binding protein [Ferribacterium limneticum]UCV17408.1 acyl carrier protein [Ferribacterium limneticum]